MPLKDAGDLEGWVKVLSDPPRPRIDGIYTGSQSRVPRQFGSVRRQPQHHLQGRQHPLGIPRTSEVGSRQAVVALSPSLLRRLYYN
ncbi:hypothetical protein CRG98_023601 [Punica granatum]|uniref:Uncharacterized protein n=1 Tax=Punica granatum TaxID=22663 RepID=A0A2I0JIC8_PUNGR|nr:hypothetical protein CRG98_023601 [Punica granatum]